MTTTRSKPSIMTTLSVLSVANYRKLFISSTCSFFGMNIQMVLLALVAWELTESFTLSGVLMASSAIPMIIFTLPGGAVADRVNKRTLTILTMTSMGSLNVITGALILTEDISVLSLLLLGIAQGSIISIGMPARMPLMAAVVTPDRVGSAIAVSNMAMNMSRVAGPMVGVAIIEILPHMGDRFDVGYEWGYFTSGLLGIFSVLPLLGVPSALAQPKTNDGQSGAKITPSALWSDIGDGLKYVARTPTLRLVMILMLVLTVFAQPFQNLIAGFVESGLGETDWQAKAGQLTAMAGVGAMIGSLLITWLAEWDRKPLMQWVSGVVTAVGFFTMTFGSQLFGFAGAVVGITLVGGATAFYMTASSTMMLMTADAKYYGRVLSLFMLSFSTVGVMSFPLGVVADAIGSLALFGVLGLCVAGSMVLLALTKPGFVFRPLHISTVPSGTTDPQTTTPTPNEDSAPAITPPRSVALADKTSRQIWHKQKLISKRKRHTGYGIFGSNGATTPSMLDPNSTSNRYRTSSRKDGYGVVDLSEGMNSASGKESYGLNGPHKSLEVKPTPQPVQEQEMTEYPSDPSPQAKTTNVPVTRLVPDAVMQMGRLDHKITRFTKYAAPAGAAAIVALVVFFLGKRKK